MKEFMLLIRNEIDHQSSWPEEYHLQFLNKCKEYIDNLKADGKLKSAQPLIREGIMLSNSSGEWKEKYFVESKEVIVGYYHLLASDLDEAVLVAKNNPEFQFGTTARIEIRPVKVKEEEIKFVYPNQK